MTKFSELANKISKQYQHKGMSPEESQKVAQDTAAAIGRRKYGEEKYNKLIEKGEKKER